MSKPSSPVLCPSSDAGEGNVQVFAVIGGTPEQPRAAYLDRALALTPELATQVAPVPPEEVYRAAAPCAQGRCSHFDAGGGRCRLAHNIVRLVPAVVRQLPRCAIRADCRWWRQEGAAACRRCPQVVTSNHLASDAIRVASDPNLP